MAWPVPAKPVNWQDTPSTATALDAANLNADEAYAATVGQSVVDYLEGNSSTVMGAPYHAKGDAKRVVDGAITIGTNQLSSSAAVFTTADVNKVVEVVGAGPGGTNNNLHAFIGSVASGVASLVTASGGSTPSNATATVSGAIVIYGTDDTTPIQNAIDATSAAGGGTVVINAGHQFLLGTITPKSNVTILAYGATLYLRPSVALGLFFMNGGSVANFYVRGGTYPGTGVEIQAQAVFAIISGASGTDVGAFDMTVTNWFTGAIYFSNCVRVRACFNTIQNCCTFLGWNAINLLIGSNASSTPYNTAIAVGNIIENCAAEGIAVGETGNTTVGQTKVVIANNIVNCASGAGGAGNTCINLEWSTLTTGEASEFVVTGNQCTLNSTSTSASGIGAVVSPVTNTDPLVLSKVVIADNVIVTNQMGINCNASDAKIDNNHVEQTGTQGFGIAAQNGTTPTGTGDIANTSTTISNVSAALVNVPNGTPIVGTGIPAAAYLVSGAGTTTWVISLAATATTSTLAITARAQAKRVTVTNNTIHAAASPTNPLLYLSGLRDSIVSGNLVTCEPGSTTTQEGIMTRYCGWVDIVENRVMYAPGNGIRWNISNDLTIARNRILNCSEGASSAFNGIRLNDTSGTIYRIEGNVIVDDRAVHKMDQGIIIASGVPTGVVEAVGNEIRGARLAPTTTVSSFALLKDNVTDSTTWPAATTTPTAPASTSPTTALPYPVTYYVFGGTVTAISHQRSGSSSRNVGTTGPATVMLAAGDTMTLTYTVAPTLMLEPCQI